MYTVPSSLNPSKRTSGGHTSVGALATLLSSHAGDPRTATDDTTLASQTTPVDSGHWSQSVADRGAFSAGRTSPSNRTLTLRCGH
jgi:hypothetical protein